MLKRNFLLLSTLLLSTSLGLFSCANEDPSEDTTEDDNKNNNNNENNGDNNEEEPETPANPITPDMSEEELFSYLKEALFEFDKDVVKSSEVCEQTDGYGAIEMVTTSKNETTRYTDFTQTLSEHQIGSSKTNMITEKGLVDEDTYYQVVYYGANDKDNAAGEFKYNPSLKEQVFGAGFAGFFAESILDSVVTFKDTYGSSALVEYNFYDLDLTTDGTKEFYCLCINGTEEEFAYKFEFGAEVKIENRKMVSANMTLLQSLYNDTNFSYLTRNATYETGEIKDYTGTKLDYTLYL